MATGARNTTHKNTENTGPTQAETASVVRPTNLRVSAESNRMKTTRLPYFIVTSHRYIFRSHNYYFFRLPL